MLKHLCPCCGRHCYLDEPQCERGVEYKETGAIPPRKPRPHGNGEGKKPSEKKMQYLSLDREGKLVWNLREMGNTISSLEETDGGELFACLREDDRSDLLMLLEKVKHDWRHKFEKK